MELGFRRCISKMHNDFVDSISRTVFSASELGSNEVRRRLEYLVYESIPPRRIDTIISKEFEEPCREEAICEEYTNCYRILIYLANNAIADAEIMFYGIKAVDKLNMEKSSARAIERFGAEFNRKNIQSFSVTLPPGISLSLDDNVFQRYNAMFDGPEKFGLCVARGKAYFGSEAKIMDTIAAETAAARIMPLDELKKARYDYACCTPENNYSCTVTRSKGFFILKAPEIKVFNDGPGEAMLQIVNKERAFEQYLAEHKEEMLKRLEQLLDGRY